MQHATNVKETTTTTGKGTLALLGAVIGCAAFADLAYGNQVVYRIQSGSLYEIGLGTVQDNAGETGYELTRDYVLMTSANTGYLDGTAHDLTAMQIDLPAGQKEVFAVSLDLSLVAQNIVTLPSPSIPLRPSASGSAALAVGGFSGATERRAVAVGYGAWAAHENATVLGNTRSQGPGFFCRGAQRDGDPNGKPTWFGDTLFSFLGAFNSVDAVTLEPFVEPLLFGKITLVLQDATDGIYVGELRFLVIDGSSLVIAQSLTQIYSTRSAAPTLSLSLEPLSAEAFPEKAIRVSAPGSIVADRILLKTEVFASP